MVTGCVPDTRECLSVAMTTSSVVCRGHMTVVIEMSDCHACVQNTCVQVFQDPTSSMQQMLSNVRPICVGVYKHETDCEYTTSHETDCECTACHETDREYTVCHKTMSTLLVIRLIVSTLYAMRLIVSALLVMRLIVSALLVMRLICEYTTCRETEVYCGSKDK